MPHDNFPQLISHLYSAFREHCKQISTETCVIHNFVNTFSLISYKHPCDNFPIKYCITLYSRVRLYYLLKCINRDFKKANIIGQKRNTNK